MGPVASGPNQAPVAQTDMQLLPLPMAISIDPLVNDSDPDVDFSASPVSGTGSS